MDLMLTLGNKPLRSGEASKTYKRRMAKTVELMRANPRCTVCISGGITRKGSRSEADLGMSLVPYDMRSRIFLERRALSTSDNMRLAREVFADYRVDSFVIVTSEYHVARTRILLKKLWPEIYPRTLFVGVEDDVNWVVRMKELILCELITLDPDENLVMPLLRAFK